MTPINLYDRRDRLQYATVEVAPDISLTLSSGRRSFTFTVTGWHDAYHSILANKHCTDIRFAGRRWYVDDFTQMDSPVRVELTARLYVGEPPADPWTFDSYLAARTTKENPMTTIDPTEGKVLVDLYEQAINTYRVEYGETIAVSHNERAVRAVVDYVLAAEPEQIDRKPYILRAAVAIVLRETGHDLYNVTELANRLEAEHRAAQEKAAADAKMDALIDESIDAYNRAAEAQASRAPLGSRDTAPWRDGIRAVIDVVLAEAGEGDE